MNAQKETHRIYGEQVTIDSKKIEDFFQKRGANADKSSPLSSTMYQDKKNVESRDLVEKDLLTTILPLNQIKSVFEFGCGVGRWGDFFSYQHKCQYFGVDFSSELIKIAQQNYAQSSCSFSVMDIDAFTNNNFKTFPNFDLFIITAVLLYLNDDDINSIFNKISSLSFNQNAYIYIREPISILDKRLTLKNFYSEDLKDEYNAIYRTEDEYIKLFTLINGFQLIKTDFIFTNELHDKKETKHRYFLLQRVCDEK